MTEMEALKEIERQEARFAAAGFGRGVRLAKSAREYYDSMMEMRRRALDEEKTCRAALEKIKELTEARERELAEARRNFARAKRFMSEIVALRKVVKKGECLKHQEHLAGLRLDEKITRLKTLPIE